MAICLIRLPSRAAGYYPTLKETSISLSQQRVNIIIKAINGSQYFLWRGEAFSEESVIEADRDEPISHSGLERGAF
jgi:hypothetical protein